MNESTDKENMTNDDEVASSEEPMDSSVEETSVDEAPADEAPAEEAPSDDEKK